MWISFLFILVTMFLSFFITRTLSLAMLIFFACTAFRTWSASAIMNDNVKLVSRLLLVKCFLWNILPGSSLAIFLFLSIRGCMVWWSYIFNATTSSVILHYIHGHNTMMWVNLFWFFSQVCFWFRKWFRYRIDSWIHRYSMRADFRYSEVMKNSFVYVLFSVLVCVCVYCILHFVYNMIRIE